jgi:prepilin-type N-terminal cleavage/methylation domain-containing protein
MKKFIKNYLIKDESGQSLMEMMIALAVGAILIGGASIAVVVVLQSGSTNQIQQSATVLAQEIVEKGRIYGMADWSNLYELEKSSSTKYFFNTSSTEIFHIEGVEGIVDGDIREGLIGHWKLDEAAGAMAYDFSGNGNDGSVNGVVATSTDNCLIGGCYSFDGSDDYVEDPDAENYINGLSAISVSIWIKSNEINTDKGFIKGNEPDGADNVLAMRYDNSGGATGRNNVIKVGISTTNNGSVAVESSADIQTTDWQHLVLTWSSGNNLKLYINGQEDLNLENKSASGSITDTTKLLIGKGAKDTAGTSWNGLIDDVRIYNRALSADEINHLYNSTFFDRYFYVENACRTNDANYSLAGAAPCDGGEVEDPSTQLFTGVVEWAGKEGESSFALSEYITRWRNDIFHQTDWSGGSGDDGPVSNSSDSYSSSTGVDSSNLGEIRIEGL